MTRSDIRRTWSDLDIDLDEIGEEATTRSSSFSYEAFARKDSAGIQNWLTNSDEDEEEANISITVIECWIRSDRDGDGIADVIDDDATKTQSLMGTPQYIAPEILFDKANGHSFEVDLWSLGVIM